MNRLAKFFLVLMLTLSFVGQALASTCEYNTKWGFMRMTYNYNNNTMWGNYAYRNGRVSGQIRGGSAFGTWSQSDGASGVFHFNYHDGGFSGYWKYNGDANWRDQWNGSLIRCY
ncbi:hypothetical protein [Desulfovibrio inopinatus]|uniref:hypothetical protein n=1 Tax=Desulfovibrio inopinatus TaxID=102109 RepID=UPI0004182A99|nr:hypothetical protein [Desulfovibrio inopinatus]